MLDRRYVGRGPAAATRDRFDLVGRQPRHKAQRRKHLHALLVDRGDLADLRLAGFGEVEVQTELEVLAEREFLTRASRGVAIAGNWPGLHRRRTAADSTLDAVPHHEVEAARVGADDRLPALDRAMDRTRHQGQLLGRGRAAARYGGPLFANLSEPFVPEGSWNT